MAAAPPIPPALPLPRSFAPQLPSPVAQPPAGQGWIHEIKYDGYRLLAFVDRSARKPVRLLTRRGLDWTDRFPALVSAFDALPCETALVDGEVVALDANGGSSLSLLQATLKSGRADAVAFFAFDLMHLNGASLETTPLLQRKAALQTLLGPPDPAARLHYCDHVVGEDGAALFERIVDLGLEGVVSKKANARYVQGRTQSWVKAKREDRERFQVVGWTEKTAGTLSALMLAEADEGGALRHVGRVGSGLSNDWARALRAAFLPLEIPQPSLAEPPKLAASSGVVHWIPQDRYEAEVAYRGRSTASDSLLQPALQRVWPVANATSKRSPAPAYAPPALVSPADLAGVRISNGDRPLFEDEDREDQTPPTKLDVALYYARVADWMLPELLDRPVSFLRAKSGRRDECFYQRHRFNGLPEGVECFDDAGRDVLAIRTPAGFLGLAQFNVIEHHPWACRTSAMERPDRLVIDLDPAPEVSWPELAAASIALRDRLKDLGLIAFPRSSGGLGLHLVCALDTAGRGAADWPALKRFAAAFATAAARDAPRLFTTAPGKSARRGKIYLDAGRAARGASAVASYSLRAAPGLPAATPLDWAELSQASGDASNFNYQTLPERLGGLARDPWAGLYESAATITRKARREVGDGD